MADDRIDVKIGASIEGLTAGLNAARDQIEGMMAPINDLASAFSALSEVFVVGFAVDKLKDFIVDMGELGEVQLHSAETLGMSVQSFTALSGAMQIAGLGTDSATTAMIRLERAAAEAQKGAGAQADAFHRLGITVTDAAGHLKSGQEILLEIADRLKDAPNDVAKLGAAFDLVGRGLGTNLIPFLNRGREGIEELMLAAREAGAPTQEMAERAAAAAESFHELGAAFEGLGQSIFDKFLSWVPTAVHYLTDITESVTRFLNVTDQAKLDNLTSGLDQLQAKLASVKEQLASAVAALTAPARAILEGEKTAIERQIAGMTAQVDALKERIANTSGAGSGTNAIPPAAATGAAVTDNGAKDARDLFEEMNQELRDRIALIQDAAGVSSAYYTRLMADERLSLAEGKTSIAQELAAEITLEQEKTALRMRSLDEELTLYQQGEAAYARVEAQKKELTEQSLAAIDALEGRAAQQQREQNEKTAREFQQIFVSPVTRSFDELMSGLMSRGQSLGATLEKVFDNLATSFAESIAKMMAQWLAFEAVMALPGGGGIASALGMSGGPLAALFSGGGLSSLFGGGTAGFGAALPEVMGVGAAFAEGSWSVPSTGQALVHQGEMIIPGAIGDAIRSGQATLGAGGGGGTLNINVGVNAMDARSILAAFNNPTTARAVGMAIARWVPVT